MTKTPRLFAHFPRESRQLTDQREEFRSVGLFVTFPWYRRGAV